MAEQQRHDTGVPLPDPDAVQQTFEKIVSKVRARPNYYFAWAAVVLLAVLAVLIALNLDRGGDTSAFASLWRRCENVRDKLRINTSAAAELVELEAYLEQIRGTPEEALALWFASIYHYREAWTDDKASFEDRRPHLEAAVAYLEELQSERFEGRDLLLDTARWYAASNRSPVEDVYRQAKRDLAWAEANSYDEPVPDAAVVAVLRTSIGDMHLQFFREHAPKLTENFLTLSKQGTYNGTAFHFIRRGRTPEPKGVMGGDPYSFFFNDPLKQEHLLRWGSGGVGYDMPPEEARSRINHRASIVTSQMREKADWNNGVQFMIMVDTDPSLDRKHTPFAKVVEGQALVEKAAERKTAAQHGPFKGVPAFSSLTTRDLVVEPVIVHKVIVYENGRAVEHAYPLADGEQTLATLASTPVQPLTGDAAYCGRLLRTVDAEGEPRRGLDIPFPTEMDAEKADPKGERK
ncbi:MAG: peptidylprolyl isomerase [Planctomycetota bacterium]|jgi:cyclophilin family peptidyl-prolyl cis-trans isomerase